MNMLTHLYLELNYLYTINMQLLYSSQWNLQMSQNERVGLSSIAPPIFARHSLCGEFLVPHKDLGGGDAVPRLKDSQPRQLLIWREQG